MIASKLISEGFYVFFECGLSHHDFDSFLNFFGCSLLSIQIYTELKVTDPCADLVFPFIDTGRQHWYAMIDRQHYTAVTTIGYIHVCPGHYKIEINKIFNDNVIPGVI